MSMIGAMLGIAIVVGYASALFFYSRGFQSGFDYRDELRKSRA